MRYKQVDFKEIPVGEFFYVQGKGYQKRQKVYTSPYADIAVVIFNDDDSINSVRTNIEIYSKRYCLPYIKEPLRLIRDIPAGETFICYQQPYIKGTSVDKSYATCWNINHSNPQKLYLDWFEEEIEE